MLGCTDILPGESLTSAESTESKGCNLLFSTKIGRLKKIGPKSSSQMNRNSSFTRAMVECACGEVWGKFLIQNVFSRPSNTEEGTL